MTKATVRCEGSNKALPAGESVHGWNVRRIATCPVCGQRKPLTASGRYFGNHTKPVAETNEAK